MKLRIKATLLLVCIGACLPLYSQHAKVEVEGIVVDDDGMPAISIVIRDKTAEGTLYGVTDMDGHFKIKADAGTSLHFSGLTYAPKIVKLNDKKQPLNVVMSFDSKQLSEVVVTAQRIVEKITPEPTDIEVVGNQYVIHPKVKIPRKLFSPDCRVIVQPTLVNLTRGTKRLFQPAVVTGKKYSITLERMLEFNLNSDPLHPYYMSSKRMGSNEMIAYTDSLYMESPEDEIRCDILMYLVKYTKTAYKDTVVIAKGTINPMRFFELDIAARHLKGEQYIPRPQKQMRGDKGEVNLTFRVNTAVIDHSVANNAIELEKMQKLLSTIDNDPSAEFTSFSITGISSPEGSYNGNLKLAQKRTQTAKETILTFLKPETVKTMRDSIGTDARVDNWERVAELMERDSLPTTRIREIIALHPGDISTQGQQIMRISEYRDLIKERYLNLLRRVEYSFNYSVLRLLNDEEIRQIYEKNYKDLSPYEFWRMFVNAQTEKEKEKIGKQALEMHPNLMPIANELAVILIGRKEPDAALLKPFVNEQAPEEVLYNHIIGLLHEREYTQVDSVVSLLPQTDLTEDIRALSAAYNGKYQEAYDYFAPQGGSNEVVLLLALKRNEEAFEKAELLPDNALAYYLRATAANRLEKLTETFAYLKKAIAEDPQYKEIARTDGDLIEVLQQIEDEWKEKTGKEVTE